MTLFKIITDSTCDLPDEYLRKHKIDIIPLHYELDGVLYGDENKLEPHVFYEKMRSGLMPTTNACVPEAARQCFLNYVEQNIPILHITFSSGLSSSYSNVMLAVKEIKEQYPNAIIYTVDSLCASLGEGLLVHQAVKLRAKDYSIEDTVQWLENNKLHLCHNFTVNDLFHLHRGGRVSRATAIIGSMVNVKPVLHVDDTGHLVPLCNVRGRKKSLNKLIDLMSEQIQGFENDSIFISHGDCLEDAQYVADLVRERFSIEDILINQICPIIGAHSGPGTVALFFMGKKR